MSKRTKKKSKKWILWLGLITTVGVGGVIANHYYPIVNFNNDDKFSKTTLETHEFSFGSPEIYNAPENFVVPNGKYKGEHVVNDEILPIYKVKIKNHNIKNFDPSKFLMVWDVTNNSKPIYMNTVESVFWVDDDHIYVRDFKNYWAAQADSETDIYTAELKQIYYENTARPFPEFPSR